MGQIASEDRKTRDGCRSALSSTRTSISGSLELARRGVAGTVHLDPRLGGNHLAATLADCTRACRSCHGTLDAPRATTTRM